MEADKKIDELIRELQNETPNCGGHYHFTRMDVPNEKADARERILKYLEQIDSYKNPYVIDKENQTAIRAEDRNPCNLILKPVTNFLALLDEKLTTGALTRPR